MTQPIQSSKININLSQTPEDVPKELFNPFFRVYNAIQSLAAALSKYAGVDQEPTDYWGQLTVDDSIFAGNMNRWYVKANENIGYGSVVSAIFTAGTLQVRNANATDNTRPACGICNTVGGVIAGNFCEVLLGTGMSAGIAGMTPGTRYFLSTTNGLITNVAPVAAGNIEQVVGLALAANRILMNLNFAWVQH